MFPTIITTERLRLRPPVIEDARAIFDGYASDPHATRFLSWAAHQSVDETREFLACDAEAAPEVRWAICPLGQAGPIGMIGASTSHRGRQVDFGYVLSRDHWGRGYMSEALAAVAQAAWTHAEVWRLEAYCHIDNVGSNRVLEKCGFTREGTARRSYVMPELGPDPQDCHIYAMTRDDVAAGDAR